MRRLRRDSREGARSFRLSEAKNEQGAKDKILRHTEQNPSLRGTKSFAPQNKTISVVLKYISKALKYISKALK